MAEFVFSTPELRNIELKYSINRIMRIAALIPQDRMIVKNNPLNGFIMKKPDVVEYERYNIREALLFSENINEIIAKFVKKLEEYSDKINTNTLYRNLKDIRVEKKESSFIDKLKKKLNLTTASGTYSPRTNTISLYEKNSINKSTLTHELIHLASSVSNKSATFCGFEQEDYIYTLPRYRGRGVNEGATEFINTLLFDYPLMDESYEKLTHLVRGITNIIGEEKFVELYFNNDLKGLINEIAKYSDKKTASIIIRGMDRLFQLTNDSYFQNKDKVQELAKELEESLEQLIINIYTTKQKELLKNKKITEEEYKNNIYRNVYAYQADIFFNEILNKETNELSYKVISKIQDYIISEELYKKISDSIIWIFENSNDKIQDKKRAVLMSMESIILKEKQRKRKMEIDDYAR